MGKGYELEREIEVFHLKLEGVSPDVPIYDRTHRIPTSGAHRGEKGDVRTKWSVLPKQILYEVKRRKGAVTAGKIYYLAESWLQKMKMEAEITDCFGVFVGGWYKAFPFRKFVVMDSLAWAELIVSVGITTRLHSTQDLYVDPKKKYGKGEDSGPTYKLVWETFREIWEKDKYQTYVLQNTSWKGNPTVWRMISWECFSEALHAWREKGGVKS